VQTDSTTPNNKPDIIIRDNEKGSFVLIDVVRQECDQDGSREDSKI
jgi:hypothetical protein